MKLLPIVLFVLAIALLLLMNSRFTLDYLTPSGPFDEAPHIDRLREVMQIVVSVGIGASSLFVILTKRFTSGDKHWAYATIGTIIGFWLNSK